MDAVADFGVRVRNALGMQAPVHGTPGLAAVIGPEDARRRDGDEQPVRMLWVLEDRVQAHPAGAWCPIGPGRMFAQPGELTPALAAVGGFEEGGIFHAGVDGIRIAQGWFQVPDALEFPGPRFAVVPEVGARCPFVDELVAHRLPGLPPVVRTLDQLSEPAGRLGCVQPVRISRRPLDVVNLPPRKVRPVDLPLLALWIRCQDECALVRPYQSPYSAH